MSANERLTDLPRVRGCAYDSTSEGTEPFLEISAEGSGTATDALDRRKQPHPSDRDRWADGTMRSGNQAARKHGVRSFEQRGESALPADLRIAVEDFRNQLIADNGGLQELTAVNVGYIRRLSELETTARLLAADLNAHGLFTAKRRVRSTYGRWLETLDRWDKFAQRIGVDRKARPVTFADAVRAAGERS